jgi:hypothetical protein
MQVRGVAQVSQAPSVNNDPLKQSAVHLASLDTESNIRPQQLDARSAQGARGAEDKGAAPEQTFKKRQELARPEDRPIPRNEYAQLLSELRANNERRDQEEIRLKVGQAYKDLPEVALKEKPVADDLYQLFLENKHVEHKGLNREREDQVERAAGSIGAQGDLSMAANYEDAPAIIRGGRPEITNDYSAQTEAGKEELRTVTMEQINQQALSGIQANLRSDDLYQVVMSNRHLSPGDQLKSEHVYSTEAFFSPDVPPALPPTMIGDPNGDPGLKRENEELVRAENMPVTSSIGGERSDGRADILTALNSATAFKAVS